MKLEAALYRIPESKRRILIEASLLIGFVLVITGVEIR
jgi:hypothetical protein